MKNKIYKSLFLGISTAIAATASYALITPENLDSKSTTPPLTTPAIQPTYTSVSINNPTITSINPKPIIVPPISLAPSKPKLKILTHTIKKGESLSIIFSKLKLKKIDLLDLIEAQGNKKQFESIYPNREIIAHIDSDNKLQELIYKKSSTNLITATRSNNTFSIEVVSEPIEKRITSIQTTIKSSLFVDGKKAGFTDKLLMQLSDIFGWDIDFALNLRKNDKITVVYEKLFAGGKEVGTGNILSAEFINQGQPFTAVRFENNEGDSGYFTPEGKSMQKAFLRTPVNFSRISSHFNLKRKHPVLNKIRAHRGVDYAAKTGTAIKTTGNGKIIFRGKKRGYGRVIIVQHGKKYSTLYAHLSKFRKGQKVGSRVKQGQIIGYVGQSGLATGPHLHYEFLVNGTHKNPLTVDLPHARPVKKALLAEFKQQTQPYIAQLNKTIATTLLAKSN
ncbi:MAG: M23 family metallopeptidase [Methylococcaceae bacterium]|nr:M23 family metallopeptidase [Methylococcaceae bacterium]